MEGEIAELSAHLDAATHRLLTLVRAFDEAGHWAGQGAKSCADWLRWRCGMSPAVAREKVRVARALAELPAMDRALAQGRVSYSKVRAMTRVATRKNEALLLDYAKYATAYQLEKICRTFRSLVPAEDQVDPPQRSVRREALPSGMVRITAELHPEEADLVWKGLDEAAEAGAHGRVAPGDCSPGAPTDPDVRISRIRLLSRSVSLRDRRCAPPLEGGAGAASAKA